MTDQQSIAEGEQQAVASVQPERQTPDKSIEAPSRSPYLKIFGAGIGTSEFELPYRTITVGRSGDDADIKLPNPSVSRIHATISRDQGQFIVEDKGSTCGTKINGKIADRHVLEHGDSIQIATYVLRFRTHGELPGAKKAVTRAKTMLRGEYLTVPSTTRLEFRTLTVEQPSAFESGETMQSGQRGLLIPTTTLPRDNTCLELQMSVTKSTTKRFFGSIMGAIPEEGIYWMCIKLHYIPKNKHDEFVASADPGPWIEVVPT